MARRGRVVVCRVEAASYPLFREPQYVLALANAIVRLSRERRLDIVHAHYAIPHATAAYLAYQILTASRNGCAPRIVTTLHGTDITLGEQQNLTRWLFIADLFLLPSSQERFGLAALEATACQVPVVAARIGGLPEVIEDGVSGFLCPTDAIDRMAERGIDLLTNSYLRARIARAGVARVRDHFRADVIVPQYEACYRGTLATNRCRQSRPSHESA